MEINSIDNKSICVKFTPDIEHQLEFAKSLGGTKESGLAGQFVVQYDVERDPQGGQVYFVIIKPVSKLLSSRFWSAMGTSFISLPHQNCSLYQNM